jgi:hypothetical protein
MIRKETNKSRHTHFLQMVEGGTCKDMKRTRLSDVNSQSGDSRERDWSGQGKKPNERVKLTNWRR